MKACEYGRRSAGGKTRCDATPQPSSAFCAAHLAEARQRLAQAPAQKIKVFRKPKPGKVLRPC